MSKIQEIPEKYNRLKANQLAAKTARETKEESDFELQDPFGSNSAMVMGSPGQTTSSHLCRKTFR